ncbi:hypothetical protein L6164_025944 [Bauhinia variegata]|uniref:Uncharacterized protein n=1 Tax=Bauhinia variegata TaxID=167791 RepID=A0ACB9M2H1_BAUVA|nr:hypothetical protein L6164_025944 [Bauhinia variegata]
METEANNHSPFDALPEACIAHIISFTTPQDACRLSLVSKIFRSAAASDTVWERFVPSDYGSLVSQSPSSTSLLASSSKKNLYFTLSDNPIIIDDGKKSFQLDRRSGKKCYMLASGDLSIIWGDTPVYWEWKPLPESRFESVAELLHVCWLEIRGKISTRMLSSKTHYTAFLVFKLVDVCWLGKRPTEVSVGILGGHSSTEIVCLDPNMEHDRRFLGLQCPRERNDGWLEIKMGEFFNLGEEDEDEQVEMSVLETRGGDWKNGLVVEGIEVRPKEDN